MFVCSQLQHIPTTLFLLPVTAASDLLVHKILLWLGYPMVKNFEDIFIRFDATHERDRHRQTDRQTDRQNDRHRRPRLCIASRGKNDVPVLYTEN